MNPEVRHFLDISAMSAEELRAILDEAHARKAARLDWPKAKRDDDAPLDGYALAMIFQKNSTRTRVSFEIGMRQLGGVSIVLDAASTQLGRGETVEDTARVLSRMVDAVMIRANSHQDVIDFALASDVPVINGLTDLSHPCQIIADIQTIEERAGAIAGKTIAWLGDGNNVCTSFIHAAEKLDFKLRIATPPAYAARAQEVAAAKAAGADIEVGIDAREAVEGADVVVTDTWVSMGDTDKDARLAAFPPYAVDEKLMQAAAQDALFLHCLPAHRGEEVADAVMDGPQSAVWDEAENRIHAQKAVLMWCLGKL
ncbi:MAG TPA: ornithine carbamoyltransferase [Vitreimonas sp.]|uniref:ornithine carbamoyltransferase n=1 Tax=Vitreimonas sp. TaxID=3069702 RepID=UPI002D56CC6D|nr:ornithine carbamoyltransferase [Vitreimonas sp.]HYD88903.1 ornithine carbamoyltransferase [Vitreimonas sp.]